MYNQGDLVRITGSFANAAGTAIDPDAVTVYYRAPDGVETELVYGDDAEVVRDSAGVYHVDIDADQSGTWYYAFRATGDGQAADEQLFRVRASTFF